jgi:hypothetical protein
VSYARWSTDSDVYVYAAVGGGFICEDCPRDSLHRCATAREMIEHLLGHRAKGDLVPESALEALREAATPDVYVDEEVPGLFTCRQCPRGSQFSLVTAREALDHVLEHRARGAHVLDETIEALRAAVERGQTMDDPAV